MHFAHPLFELLKTPIASGQFRVPDTKILLSDSDTLNLVGGYRIKFYIQLS